MELQGTNPARCQGGQLRCNSTVLAACSPVLKRTLQDFGEEAAMVLMPDSPLEEVDSLLSLLYTGSCAQTEGLGALLRTLRVRISYIFSMFYHFLPGGHR